MAAVTSTAAESTRAVADRVRDAAARGDALRITGRGTWLDAGRAARDVRAADSLSLRDHAGIVEYVPGDLTLTVRAGTTLGEIRDATAAHNQWLAFDPHGSDDGTIGASVATASAGPLSSAFGLPRDLTLGVEFVTGAGAIVRGGGRVVKNVAGFDLTRLIVGSWGTLGVITEVALRLHARPEADETLGVPLRDESRDAARVHQFLRRMPFTPYACELLNSTAARTVTGRSDALALFRLGGNPEAVRGQRASLAELGDVIELSSDVWTRLRSAEPADAIAFRMSQVPSKIDELWRAGMRVSAACAGSLIVGRPVRGSLRCIVPANPANVSWLARHFADAAKSFTRVGERLPGELWSVVDGPSAADALSRSIKAKFDPNRVLNPGILGEAS
ncbi:MAG TPA: FAD-binding protein [Gemmatimonadaceae bacterium]|nr:FAD-binding protein [Gemmatimonadaceae bacterium]